MSNDQIKTRPDGSIDTEFYMNRGRLARSRAAHGGFRNVLRVIRKGLSNALPVRSVSSAEPARVRRSV